MCSECEESEACSYSTYCESCDGYRIQEFYTDCSDTYASTFNPCETEFYNGNDETRVVVEDCDCWDCIDSREKTDALLRIECNNCIKDATLNKYHEDRYGNVAATEGIHTPARFPEHLNREYDQKDNTSGDIPSHDIDVAQSQLCRSTTSLQQQARKTEIPAIAPLPKASLKKTTGTSGQSERSRKFCGVVFKPPYANKVYSSITFDMPHGSPSTEVIVKKVATGPPSPKKPIRKFEPPKLRIAFDGSCKSQKSKHRVESNLGMKPYDQDNTKLKLYATHVDLKSVPSIASKRSSLK